MSSCTEKGLGACCSGSWESCSSAQISTSCWLHLVAGCFTPFASDCCLSTNVNRSATPFSTVGKLSPPPMACRSPRVEGEVTVIKERSWQCHSCTYEQDFVPGSRIYMMCNLTRRRLHGAPQIFFGESKPPIVWRGGRGKLYCPNCRLGNRCKACLLAPRENLHQ